MTKNPQKPCLGFRHSARILKTSIKHVAVYISVLNVANRFTFAYPRLPLFINIL